MLFNDVCGFGSIVADFVLLQHYSLNDCDMFLEDESLRLKNLTHHIVRVYRHCPLF